MSYNILDVQAEKKYINLKKKGLQSDFESFISKRFESLEQMQKELDLGKQKQIKKLKINLYPAKIIIADKLKTINPDNKQDEKGANIDNSFSFNTPYFKKKDEIKLTKYRQLFGTMDIQNEYSQEKNLFLENYVLVFFSYLLCQQKDDKSQQPHNRTKSALLVVRQTYPRLSTQEITLTQIESKGQVRIPRMKMSQVTTQLTGGTLYTSRSRERLSVTKSTLTVEERKQILLDKKRKRMKQKLEDQYQRQDKNIQQKKFVSGHAPAAFNHLSLDQKYEFPQWISMRKEFKELQSSKYFNLNLKLISICEIESFKRDESQKTMVALYLQKLSLFKLMPFDMLTQLGGRITTKHCSLGHIVCRQGDHGDCMYIIYKGEIGVSVNEIIVKTFAQNEHLGRNSLENDAPRSATLIATKESHLLLLARWDYQQCLQNIFKIERIKWRQFIDSIIFLRNFSQSKIDRLCSELKGKFLSQKDCLYKVGDDIQCVYIVKNGSLVKTVVVDIEKANRWPIGSKKWAARTVTTRLSVPLKYPPQSILGYFEIVSQETLQIKARTETIDASEDCFVLYLLKSQFVDIFDADDQKIFKDFYVKNHPVSFEHLIESVKKEEQAKIKQLNVIREAITQNLDSYPTQILDSKKRKYQRVLDNAQDKFRNFQDNKTIISIDERIKYIASYYE